MTQFENFVTVVPRFTRSIHLEKDFNSDSSIDGYILTATARHTLGRVFDAINDHTFCRSWTLTGPYGSGKSSFGLFLARLLNGNMRSDKQARAILKEADAALFARFVLLSGWPRTSEKRKER